MLERFRPKPSVIHEKFDDEIVVVDLESGRYYNLMGSGSAIWLLALSGLSQPEIVAAARDSYDGDGDEIARETTAFLDLLVAEAILERSQDGNAADAIPRPVLEGVFVPPSLQKYTDMEELLLLDPVHEVDKLGWPSVKPKIA